tara:strand:+ start:1797 stop:2828 length:1032 start_codon:yes stop_codon:yes gene_type:complete
MEEQKKEPLTKQASVTTNAMKYLFELDDEDLNNEKWIPPFLQKHVNKYAREGRKVFDQLMDASDRSEKSSDEHIEVRKEIEHVAKTFMTVKKQLDKYKGGIKKFKKDIGEMNKGTQDSAYFINNSIYGSQFDAFHIDKNGLFNFVSIPENTPKELDAVMGAAKDVYMKTGEWGMPIGGSLKLHELPGIVTEPYGMKNHVMKLANKTKVDKDSGKGFDKQWTYTSTLDKLTQAGPTATIGMAFADLASDNQTKSFAEMYEEGMKEEYYKHPDTGEELPEGLLWMKDPANSDVVSKLLSKYIANVMQDVHGPTINEDTGQVKTTRSQMAQDLIKKYSHSTHKGHK